MEHNHDLQTACPKCGLAPRLPQNALTVLGFEFLTKTVAPCMCGGSPVQIEGGEPRTFRYYCESRCGMDSGEWPTLPQAVLQWNQKQIAKGFDARKLHPLNQ